jgi:GTPase Era involved in 16S rRNA processing
MRGFVVLPGSDAKLRPDVERLVGHPVFLELVVKVRSKWRRDPKMIERLGM